MVLYILEGYRMAHHWKVWLTPWLCKYYIFLWG